MVPHHELGIRMLNSAARRADDVRLRRLVFEMSSYHDHELHELRTYFDDWDLIEVLDFPGRIGSERVDALDESSGIEHDVNWLWAMIEHHEGAMIIAQRQVDGGSRPSLRALAEKAIVVQGRELVDMHLLIGELCSELEVTACADSDD
jgi:uncharacterized protein (DUF305 family)